MSSQSDSFRPARQWAIDPRAIDHSRITPRHAKGNLYWPEPLIASTGSFRSIVVQPRHSTLLLVALALCGPTYCGCKGLRRPSTLSQLAESREFIFEGQAQALDGDWDRAEELFRDAVEACPQDERAHSHLAESLWNQGQTDEALVAQQKAVEINPNEVRHRLELGDMYLAAGNPQGALVEAEAVLDIDRLSFAGWNLKGNALDALGRQRDALAAFQRSLAIDDSQNWVYARVAHLYEREQRPQRALATWQTLEDRFDSDAVPPDVLYHEALALRELTRHEEAIERLLLARRHDPDSIELLATLADLQWEVGDRGSAQLTLNGLRNGWPNHPRVESMAERWRQQEASGRVLR
ncbi:MAG: tetratricopeptide repeat protein [Planctomycetales bacterium]|nr:tetratricopeptide repeat protein [Planctomycetales bacterium]